MTFQNFITRVPKWNHSIIEQERKRICEKSRCEYLEDLISCVHIIQLKVLTSMRVGNKQKKISINIPKVDDFIHKIYINVARKLYKNVYLFEVSSSNLETQKNNRAFEVLIQECILLTIRESIPIESIIKSYMDETIEEEVIEEIKEEVVEEVPPPADSEVIQNTTLSKLEASERAPEVSNSTVEQPVVGNVSFNDVDFARDENNTEVKISAPKTIERLEELEKQRAQKQLETDNDDDSNESIRISDIHVDLNMLDINDLNDAGDSNSLPDMLLDDIEVLE